MPPNTHVFLLGLAVGTVLLVFGVLLGFWLGRNAPPADTIDRQKFLSFLQNLSSWTNEYSGDVSRYHAELTAIDEKFRDNPTPQREELLAALQQILQANRQLKARLENAEQKLEVQTDQISSYLTEARTDGLTGLFNRRAFDNAVDGLYADWSKKGQQFSLGLVDIDHFKQINDTYGHLAGDQVLTHISQILAAEMGDTVCVSRYGGEEFAVLSLASAENLAAALDDMRDTVGQAQVTHEGQVIAVTLSAGAAQIQADDKIGSLIRRADDALYAAKLGGRNRVYLHDDAMCRLITQVNTGSSGNQASNHSAAVAADSSAGQTAAVNSMHGRIAERLRRIVEEESQRFVQR